MKKILVVGGGITAAALIYLFLRPVFAGQVILNPEFYLGSFAGRFYGVILGLAVLVGYFVVRQNAWRFGLSKDEADKISFWAIVCGIIAARAYFVLFDLQYFLQNPVEIFQVWNGGLSIYGGLVGGVLFVALWCRKKIYSYKQVLDLAVLGLPLAQAVGRFGNLFNYEAYGQATNLPWKMFVPLENRIDESQSFYHPAFLYESVANIVLFFLLLSLRGKMKPGQLAVVYLIGYSLIRFTLEFIRVDSVWVAGWRVDQIVSGILFLLGVGLLFRLKPTTK